jgi:hypothetical protein
VNGFDVFRSRRPGWVPRTPAGALRGVGEGLLPPESFIVASTSTKPLDEEPVDLEGVERELARAERSLETSMLLRDIFSTLARDGDPEAALFGAEGINALEGRHLERIRALKEKPARRAGAAERSRQRALAREYHDLASLYQGERAVRAFYLRAAFTCLQKAHTRGKVHKRDLELMVDTLLSLGLPEQAAHRLSHVRAQGDPLVLLLTARVAFVRRDYTRVAALCARLAAVASTLTPEQREVVSWWTGDRG